MALISVSYGYTKNMGNFESQRIEARIERDLEKDETFEDGLSTCLFTVKEFVKTELGIEEEEIIRPRKRR